MTTFVAELATIYQLCFGLGVNVAADVCGTPWTIGQFLRSYTDTVHAAIPAPPVGR